MSRKTDSIHQALDRLGGLQQRLSQYGSEHPSRELQDIEFEMKQQLELLSMWFDSLYKFNGKSTSRAKQNASRENGRKGGRPPKEVTLMKRRLVELEEKEIPSVKSRIFMTDDIEEEKTLKKQLRALERELKELRLRTGVGEV